MAEAGGRLAAIREKFEKKNNTGVAFVPTPENAIGRLKQNEINRSRAVRIARARAARYNMTLRSLAIQTHADVSKKQKSDAAAKKEAQERASKYNMTSRALPVAAMNSRDQQNIAKALQDTVSPTIAKDVISAVAQKRHKEDIVASTALVRDRGSKPQVDLPPPQTEEMSAPIPVTPKKEPVAEVPAAAEKKSSAAKPGGGFKMDGLQEALQNGDADALNKLILYQFLTTNAPQLLPKFDQYLKDYKQNMNALFSKLLTETPDDGDTEIAGQQKAEKEIAEAVESNHVRPVKEEAPAPKPAPVPKKVETPPPQPEKVESEVEDDDDSMIVTPENMDSLDIAANADKKSPKITAPTEAPPQVVEEEDEDSSLIVEEDKAYQDSYEKTIKAAEDDPSEALKAAARRRKTMQVDNELTKELQTTYNDPKLSMAASVASDSSLVQTGEATLMDGGYIIEATMEEEEEGKEEAPRWAVQFENKNYALKQKLLKQGLSKQQVEDLVDNLDTNTSEML